MSIGSLLAVLVTVCGCVWAERAEVDLNATASRSIGITQHSNAVAGGPDFYTCCLKDLDTVTIYPAGLKSTEGRKCTLLATVAPQSCYENGEAHEEKCKESCNEEFKKYVHYHELVVAYHSKNSVDIAEEKLQTSNDALSMRQGEQDSLNFQILSSEKRLAELRIQKKAKDAEVKEAHETVNSNLETLQTVIAENAKLKETKDASVLHDVPEPCQGAETCCCNINHNPVRVPTKRFMNWEMCKTPQKYEQPQFTVGTKCGFMKDCDVCRTKICSRGAMMGIC